jgi:hypothetical protein
MGTYHHNRILGDNSKKRKVLKVPVRGAQKLKSSQAAGERHPISRARHPPAFDKMSEIRHLP